MIDLLATWQHYRDHLQPVWDGLPATVRGPGDAALVAGWADAKRAHHKGYRRIALLEHGIGQSYSNANPAYPGGAKRDAVGLFLSPNETAASRDRAAYPRARVEVVGAPKIDCLPSRDGGGPTTVAISFRWNAEMVQRNEGRWAWPFYRDVLPDLARSFHLIGHCHPRVARLFERIYGKLGIEYVPTFADVCRRADVYVCDGVSTLYEFAATGRPVVVLNAPWYRRSVEHGLRFWEAADVGIQVDQTAALVSAVTAALEDAPARQQAREHALSVVYGLRTNGAAAAATAVLDWLAEPSAVAA